LTACFSLDIVDQTAECETDVKSVN